MSHSIPSLKLCSNGSCGNIATGYNGFCYNCSQTERIRNYSASPKPRSTVKNPMGVEIECFNPSTVNKVTHVAKFVCKDGSLPLNGGEIKLCSPESKIEDVVADTVNRSMMVGNIVNRQCGLHVHINVPEFLNYSAKYSDYTQKRLFSLFKPMEDYLFDIMPESRKNNGYCKRLDNSDRIYSHYAWATISEKYPTVEIRLHSGTMNPWKAKAWVNVWKQLRPVIQTSVKDQCFADFVSNNISNNGIKSLLDTDSIGYKYLLAREQSNGILENFGFQKKPKKEQVTFGTEFLIVSFEYWGIPNYNPLVTHYSFRQAINRIPGIQEKWNSSILLAEYQGKMYLLNYGGISELNCYGCDVDDMGVTMPRPEGIITNEVYTSSSGRVYIYRPILGNYRTLRRLPVYIIRDAG